MSIFKYILSPFVEFKPDDNKKAESEPNAQPAENLKPLPDVDATPVTGTTSLTASQPASVSPVSGTSAVTTDYQKHFEDLIAEANLNNPNFQGTDFKEFIDSKFDVEAIADEETRYKTAFNVLKRAGLTKERLVSTGRDYINVIENDIKGFESAYTQQYKTNVEQKDLLLQKKAAELQELNKRIAVLNQEISQMSQEIVQSREKLNSNKQSFTLAGEHKKKEIQNELQKIDQYFT
jgi:uncharacterized small protein (DUF1192 family)